MIHVDTRRLGYHLPSGWLKKAAKAQQELDAAATPETAREILRRRRLWADLLDELRRESKDKCWYSEARNEASRMDVDHYRPKGTVREADGTTRPGYPFLAYDFRNYRLSAQLPNQATATEDGTRGKHQQFPVADPSKCAVNKAGIRDEKPLLLDPTDPEDPRLLTFDEQGLPRPAVKEAEDPLGYVRADRTIDVLWLDRTQLSDARHGEWAWAHQIIVAADDLMQEAAELSAQGRRAEADARWARARPLVAMLRKAAQPTAPYSASMQACLVASARTWAQRIAERASRRSLVLYDKAA